MRKILLTGLIFLAASCAKLEYEEERGASAEDSGDVTTQLPGGESASGEAELINGSVIHPGGTLISDGRINNTIPSYNSHMLTTQIYNYGDVVTINYDSKNAPGDLSNAYPSNLEVYEVYPTNRIDDPNYLILSKSNFDASKGSILVQSDKNGVLDVGIYAAIVTIESETNLEKYYTYFMIRPTIDINFAGASTAELNSPLQMNYTIPAGSSSVAITLDDGSSVYSNQTDQTQNTYPYSYTPTSVGELNFIATVEKYKIQGNVDTLKTDVLAEGLPSAISALNQQCETGTAVKTVTMSLPVVQGCSFGSNDNLQKSTLGYQRLMASEKTSAKINFGLGQNEVVCGINQIRSVNSVFQDDQIAFTINDALVATSVDGFHSLLSTPVANNVVSWRAWNKKSILGDTGYSINGVVKPPQFCLGGQSCIIPARKESKKLVINLAPNEVQQIVGYYSHQGVTDYYFAAHAFGDLDNTDCSFKESPVVSTPNYIEMEMDVVVGSK